MQVFLDGSHRDSLGTSEWPAEAEGTWEMQAFQPDARIFGVATVFSLPRAALCFPHQEILNNDETTYVLENLEIDTPYDVSVTAIYPDEAESEDLLGMERTCKGNHASCQTFASQFHELNPVFLKLLRWASTIGSLFHRVKYAE